MISGVEVRPLRRIPDERGMLMEILRADDPLFRKFGQVYVSTIYPGVVKGWHCHHVQTDYVTILKGMVKLVLYDDREGSPTRGEVAELFAGEQNPVLVVVPPFVWHGMKGVGAEPAYMLNCPTETYSYEQPDEFRRPPDDPGIPYDWQLKQG
ncbi:dTDP-4-dehydrorhamnose 3,5-epimerase [candidate division WOR-3 bacterium]|nr:dTDP-4-dehydrorhamnose 3,5-epimerase [candidate division WOR-3 bacterium]